LKRQLKSSCQVVKLGGQDFGSPTVIKLGGQDFGYPTVQMKTTC